MAYEIVSSSITTDTDVRKLRTIYAGYLGHRLLDVTWGLYSTRDHLRHSAANVRRPRPMCFIDAVLPTPKHVQYLCIMARVKVVYLP